MPAELALFVHRFSYCFNTNDRGLLDIYIPLDIYIRHISRHEYTRHTAVNLYSASIKAALRLHYGTIKVRIVRLRLYYEEAVLRGRGSIKRRREY